MQLALAALSGLLAAAEAARGAAEAGEVPAATYPEWAHKHWVWIPHSQSNQTTVLANLEAYRRHNIAVGGVNVDSGWATGYNSFVFDETKFPDPQGLVDDIHARGARMILWVTSMVDTDSPNYKEGLEKGYFVKSPFGSSPPLKWWHGKGGLVDYTNPEAVAWWHAQMDRVLDLGVDGWKCDGTDPYLALYLAPRGEGGPLTYRKYADAYYGDFFDYTRERLGEDRLIMSRPVDSYNLLAPVADAYLSFSPRRVVLSGWVGDQDPTFDGLQDALRNMVHSAWRGYPNFGSDIAGYRGGERTAELFTRWFQLGAFLPLMENGGENDHQPWAYDAAGGSEVTDAYRRFATQHDELTPYLLSVGSEALERGGSSVRPVQPPPPFEQLALQLRSVIHTFDYTLGDRIFVSPITEEGTRVVTLNTPGRLSQRWVDLFHPARGTLRGGAVYRYPAPLADFPVFHLAGAILPLHATSSLLGHAPADTPAAPALATPGTPLTLLVHAPADEGDALAVREFGRPGARVAYSAHGAEGTLKLDAGPYAARPVAWLVRDVVPAGGAGEVKATLRMGGPEAAAAALAAVQRSPELYHAWEEESPAVPAPKTPVAPGICREGGPWFAKGADNAGFAYDAEARTLWVFAGCATKGASVEVSGLRAAEPRDFA